MMTMTLMLMLMYLPFFLNARQVAHVALPFRAEYFEVLFSGTNHHMDLLF